MLIEINMHSFSPIYEQLRDQIVLGIAAGRLAPNEHLPSVRGLAADLGINFHTVNKAYTMLCDEGFIVIDRRKGALVAQSVTCDEEFISKLSQKLLLAAAEAACRNVSESDFIALCGNCYRAAKDNRVNGGTS